MFGTSGFESSTILVPSLAWIFRDIRSIGGGVGGLQTSPGGNEALVLGVGLGLGEGVGLGAGVSLVETTGVFTAVGRGRAFAATR